MVKRLIHVAILRIRRGARWTAALAPLAPVLRGEGLGAFRGRVLILGKPNRRLAWSWYRGMATRRRDRRLRYAGGIYTTPSIPEVFRVSPSRTVPMGRRTD